MKWNSLCNCLFRACLIAVLVVGVAPDSVAVPGPLEDAHRPLKRLLKDFVRYEQRYDRGLTYERAAVRYPQLAMSTEWEAYRKGLTRYNKSKIASAPPDDRKAFWLNTYNTLVLDAIRAEYTLAPSSGNIVGSVRRIPDFFTRQHPVAGLMISLKEIENKLEEFGDPRVWFALNRGAVSSPGVPHEPFNQTDITEQLDLAVRNFLADPAKFRLDRDAGRLHLSALLQERAALFNSAPILVPSELTSYPAETRRVVAFLLPYMPRDVREYVLEKKPSIEFEPFDWSLNLAE